MKIQYLVNVPSWGPLVFGIIILCYWLFGAMRYMVSANGLEIKFYPIYAFAKVEIGRLASEIMNNSFFIISNMVQEVP